MFVEYGYDYFQLPPPIEFDDSFYKEMVYPIKKKEVFNNNCNELIIAVEGNNWSKWNNPKVEKDNNKINLLL